MGKQGVHPRFPEAIAVVTGASSGIGLAFARQLASVGFNVVAVSTDKADGPALLSTLDGARHRHVTADLSTNAGLNRVADILTKSSTLEVLVNAAGRGVSELFVSDRLDDELLMLDLNVRVPLVLTHAAIHSMRRAGTGTIFTVASTAGFWSGGTYSASKAWVLAFSDGVARSLKGSGVQMTCVAPGFTNTNFFDHAKVPVRTRRASWLWLTPKLVVHESLQAAGRGYSLCIPTRRYRFLVRLARSLPHGARHRLVAVLSRAAGLE